MERGQVPPGGSEHLPDRHDVGGGIVTVEDRLYDLIVGSLTENTLHGDLLCPFTRTVAQETIVEQVGVGAIHQVFDLAQFGVDVGGNLPTLVDLYGVGEGVGHGVSVVDLFSIGAEVGALLPPVCHLSRWHRLLDLCLLDLTIRPCCFAPVAASGLGAVYQQSEGTFLEAGAILGVYFIPSSDSIILSHEHFSITGEHTFIDQVVELATIGGSEVEVLGQFQTNKQWQVLAVAVELQIRIVESNHNPCLKIGGREEVSRLVNTDELSSFLACFLEFSVKKRSTIARLESINNCLEVVLPVVVDSIILYLRRSSETTELGVLTVNNRTLAVSISNRHGEALESTWAGAASRQVEDHGLLVEFSVAVGEVKHCPVVWLTCSV